MYVNYFKFSGKPFGINPDPRFYFNSNTHKKALLYLGEGLGNGQGFIVVTGDSGMGKTTLMTALQYMLDDTNIVIARIVNTQLDSGELLRYVAAELNLPYEDLSKVSLLKSIEHLLLECQTNNQRVVVIVDEAQSLSDSAIDELRMLMNIISDNNSLIQIILFGQTRLKEQISSDNFEPLKQRIVAKYHLEYFDQQQTKAYIFHRLRTVGWIGNPAISPEAFIAVHQHSKGIPAKINMICERILLAACLKGTDIVSATDVLNIVREMDNDFSDIDFQNSLVEDMIDVLVADRLDTVISESNIEPVQQKSILETVLSGPNEGQVLDAVEKKVDLTESKKNGRQPEVSIGDLTEVSLTNNGFSEGLIASDPTHVDTLDDVQLESIDSDILPLPNENLIIDFNEEDIFMSEGLIASDPTHVDTLDDVQSESIDSDILPLPNENLIIDFNEEDISMSEGLIASDPTHVDTLDDVQSESIDSDILPLPNENLIIDFNEEDISMLGVEERLPAQTTLMDEPVDITSDNELEMVQTDPVDLVKIKPQYQNYDESLDDVFSTTEENLMLELIETKINKNEFRQKETEALELTDDQIILEEFNTLGEDDLILIEPESTAKVNEDSFISEHIQIGGAIEDNNHFVNMKDHDQESPPWLQQQKDGYLDKEKDEFDFHEDNSDTGHLNPFSKSVTTNSDDTVEELF